MQTGPIIVSIITGVISAALLIYAYFAFIEKGPILSNTVLFASAEERNKLDRSAEYRMVSVVFGLLGMVFLLLTVRILTGWEWLNYFMGFFIAFLMIYAVRESVRSERKNGIDKRGALLYYGRAFSQLRWKSY